MAAPDTFTFIAVEAAPLVGTAIQAIVPSVPDVKKELPILAGYPVGKV